MTAKRLPYPGLRAFTREESDLFFGRDGCVDRMVDRLAATRFLAVLGPSGGGKSSLVRTGLLDALDLGLHSSAGSRWRVAEMHPGGSPLRNLAAALLRARDRAVPDAGEVARLTQFLRRGPRAVSEWATGGNLPEDWNLLILVDQFEELFRYGDYAQREEAEAFAELLLETASVPMLKLHVVLTMRSEYLGACSLLPGLAERVNDGIYLTPRMSREECREAIEGPARVLGFRVEPALVTRLLNDLSSFAPWESDPGARQGDQLARRADQLPLMQHVLNRLWIRATNDAGDGVAELKLADYEECGGLSGAIDSHANEIMKELGQRAQRVEAIFRALVSGASVAMAVRRPCTMQQLIEVVGSKRHTVAIVEAFSAADCSFLRPSDDSLDDDVIVDISHESLIRQWTSLREWLEEEARDDAEWSRLITAQQRHAAGREQFLSGLSLHSLAAWFDEAKPTRGWAARHGGRFDEAREFLEKSREAEGIRTDAERRREIRERNVLRTAVGALAALVLLGAWMVLKLNQEKESKSEFARKLVSVIDEVGRTVHADEYVSLVGLSGLQSRLTAVLVNRQKDLASNVGGIVSPESRVGNRYQLAVSLDEDGRAQEAMQHFKEAYELGKTEIDGAPPEKPVSDDLKIVVIQDAGRYAWRLFEAGQRQEAKEIVDQMERWVGKRQDTNRWRAANATVHSLKSRYYRDGKQFELAENETREAIRIMEPITQRALASPHQDGKAGDGLSMDQMRLAYWLHMGLYRSSSDEAEKMKSEQRACTVARTMIARNAMDRRALGAHVSCLLSPTMTDGDLAAARANAEKAREIIKAPLQWVARDQSLLLLRAQIESTLASLATTTAERNCHIANARADFVKALEERTLFASTSQVGDLYDKFKKADSSETARTAQAGEGPSDIDGKIAFYRAVLAAIDQTAFPNAPVFVKIRSDAPKRIQELEAEKSRPHQPRTVQAAM